MTVMLTLHLFRIATAIVIFYPLIRDRVLRTIDYDCKFLPDKNPEFVVAMAFVGHHVPCVVIVVCYAVVYYEIRRLIKTRPQHFDLMLCTPRPQDIFNISALFSAHLVHHLASTPWPHALHTLLTRELLHFRLNYVYIAIKTRPQHFGLMLCTPRP